MVGHLTSGRPRKSKKGILIHVEYDEHQQKHLRDLLRRAFGHPTANMKLIEDPKHPRSTVIVVKCQICKKNMDAPEHIVGHLRKHKIPMTGAQSAMVEFIEDMKDPN